MRRICVTIRSLGAGGAEKQSVLLARALAERHRVHLVAVSQRPCLARHQEALAGAGVRVHFLRGSPVGKLRQLTRLLASEQIEISFSHLPGDTLFAALAAARSGVPVRCGGIRNSHLVGRKWRVLRFLHNRLLTCTIANCAAGRDVFVARGFQPDKLLVIPNGIEIGSSPAPRRHRPPELRILSVGRLVAQKDYRTALQAVATVRGRLGPGAPISYTIVGHGPLERRIRSWARDLGLADRVRIHVNGGGPESFYEQADLYLCSSRFEGLSNALLEAMNHALPLVVTDAGDNRLLVEDGINGRLAKIGDHQALAEGLEDLLRDDSKRDRFGRESFERVRSYSFEAFQKRYLELVETFP